VTPRSDVIGYQRFGGSCCLHLSKKCPERKLNLLSILSRLFQGTGPSSAVDSFSADQVVPAYTELEISSQFYKTRYLTLT